MLTYIASYPRCGNAWIRSLIILNWRYLVANGYPDDWNKTVETGAKYKICAPESKDAIPRHARTLLRSHIAQYTNPLTGEIRYTLKPSALELMVDDNRRMLAESEHRYFLKTHDMPFDRFFEGESVVQIVRHPGAALASFCRLEGAFGETDGQIPQLHHFIRGRTAYGDWSDYHRRWRDADVPTLRVRFEDGKRNEMEMASQIGGFLGFDQPPTIIDFFNERHTANPARNPHGSIDRWREDFDQEALELLQSCHGDEGAIHGYDIM